MSTILPCRIINQQVSVTFHWRGRWPRQIDKEPFAQFNLQKNGRLIDSKSMYLCCWGIFDETFSWQWPLFLCWISHAALHWFPLVCLNSYHRYYVFTLMYNHVAAELRESQVVQIFPLTVSTSVAAGERSFKAFSLDRNVKLMHSSSASLSLTGCIVQP